MLRHFLTVAVLLGSTGGLAVAAEKLSLDKDQSKIEFVGSKDDGKHKGGFKTFTADVVADFENPSNGSLEINIDANSLWSDDEKLTNHLKNPDFFDVRKYPKIKFKATKITHSESDKSATVTGVLEMLGKEVEVSVPVTTGVSEKSLTLKTSFKIDRTKWGMTYGEGKIHNDVEVNATLVFAR